MPFHVATVVSVLRISHENAKGRKRERNSADWRWTREREFCPFFRAFALSCFRDPVQNGIKVPLLICWASEEHRTVLQPLEMKHSAQGLGRFTLDDMIAVQTERAAPESGGGDPSAKEWDWNSPYWRKLGAPWGGAHASAPDIGRFLAEFLHAQGKVVKPKTARLMVKNHNPAGLTPRGLGFNVGVGAGSKGCSEATFGHTGSTGTLCWADPRSQTICVVLTSLPGRAVQPHPRDLAGDRVAAST